jgi:predicted phage-related endonuclease
MTDYEPDLDDDIDDDMPDVIALTDDDLEAIEELKYARAEASEHKKRADELRTELLQKLGSAQAAFAPDGRQVLRIRKAVRRTVNAKALEAKYPDVYDEVMSETETTTLETP